MHITLKLATSLDGKIALRSGESQWITSAESRAYGHKLRAAHDGILIGANTAHADDPLLTARSIPLPSHQPVRIVADSTARLSPQSRLANSAQLGRVILATTDAARDANLALLSAQGVEYWNCSPPSGSTGVDLHQLCRFAGSEGIQSVLVEGGGQVAASFLRAGLVTTIEWFRAPVIIGGDGICAIAALSLDTLGDMTEWRPTQTQALGHDTHTTYVRV